MPNYRTLFQDHHNIEQQTLKNSELLDELQRAGKFDIHAPENRLLLPANPAFAQAMGITPHSGGPLSAYQYGLLDHLEDLYASRDGQAMLEGDPAAMDRVVQRVERLRDTVKVGLINGDLNTNTPVGLSPAQTNQRVQDFFRDIATYQQTHAQQIEALKGFTGVDHGWGAVVNSEARIVTALNQIQTSNIAITRGGNIELQRGGLSLAIANAHHDGRIVMSERGILVVEKTLGEDAAHNLRVPRGQRGEAAMELLMGEASARGLTRAGGLLTTGADAVMTARTASALLEQGNATAAQSEVTHALARNVGGWAGGASTAAALGGSGFVPAALVVGDALLMSKAFDKGADLLDNRAIYHQTDKAGVEWQFNGRDWERQAAFDGSSGHPTQEAVGASYAKSKELGAMANAKAVELALGKAPPPQDPFNVPAQASDQVGLDNQNWHRNPATETWERPVKTGVTGADDRGVYEPQIANAEQTQRLNQEALARIETNIGTGREAIAQAYLESHAAQRGQDYGVGVPAAVESAHAKPDRVQGHDGQTYQRHESGQWAGKDGVASGNLAAELELTNQMRQPSLERAQETLAAIEARPAPTAAEMEHNELLHRYRAAGVDLNVNPQTQQAVELAAQRTRDANGITGPTMQQLQRNEAGQYGYDSPIAHLQQGPDGIARVVAVTSSDDIRQALSETQGNRRESPTLGRVLEGTADADTSTSESSNPQQVLDIQARMQASVAAQARQEREQQDRLAQEQHAAQVREHLQQAQPEHEDRSQSEQAVQAHAALEGQRQAEQQRELEERQVQERQVQTSQQRELQEREERDAQQRQEQERQAEDNQQREQQDRQAQETRQVGAQEGLARQAQQQDQHQEASHQPDPQLHAPDAVLVQQTLRPELQQADPYQQLEAHNQQVGERAAHTTLDQRTQATGPGDAHPHHAQEAARALERQALESRDAAHLQVPPSGDRESGGQPAQSVQADAVSPALYRHVQTQPAEMEQALIRQQDVKREQEAAPVRVMAQITPAGQSLGGSVENRFPTAPADVENRQAQSIPGQDRSAADPGGALFLEETMRSLRQLQQEIELADREDERFHQEWKEYRDRGEPYPFAHHDTQRVQGASLDGFPQHEQARRSPSGAAEQTDAFPPLAQRSIGPGGKDASSDSSQVERKSITGDPDVDEVLYALDSKNELAIEQALNRVANSAATQALIKRGNEFLEAQAQQEAQEHVATRQALGMDVSAEINTSRGPVMVMTLPEFAKGPMQSGPQGGGGGGGDGGGGGGSGGGGGG